MEGSQKATTESGRHTPGDWRWSRLNWRNEIDNDRLYICAENERGFFTGVCIVEGNRTSQITTEANAHLIAAAPDLLAACEALVRVVDSEGLALTDLDGYAPESGRNALSSIYAAIAKAKGGAA